MRNNEGPSIEPWGTPDSTLVNWKNDPFKTTRCFRLSK